MNFSFRLFLVLSLLLVPGTWAFSNTVPPQPPLKLLQSPTQTRITPQGSDIRDIKGPVPLPDAKRFILPAAVGIIAILAVLLFFYLRRKRKPQTIALSPDVVALRELDQAKALMTPDQSLIYAQRISNILRQYIEVRFHIRSTRQTTIEFFSHLKEGTTIAEVDIKNHAQDLQTCLEQCDIAKFAHGIPDNDDMIQMDKAARTFIERTRQDLESTPVNPPPRPPKG